MRCSVALDFLLFGTSWFTNVSPQSPSLYCLMAARSAFSNHPGVSIKEIHSLFFYSSWLWMLSPGWWVVWKWTELSMVSSLLAKPHPYLTYYSRMILCFLAEQTPTKPACFGRSSLPLCFGLGRLLTWLNPSRLSARTWGRMSPIAFAISILSRSKRATFTEIKDKVQRRVAGWKAKVLLQAGHTVLIKFVASDLPFHLMSIFSYLKAFVILYWCDVEKLLVGSLRFFPTTPPQSLEYNLPTQSVGGVWAFAALLM